MINFLANLPTFAYFIVILGILFAPWAAYLLGSEVGEERGFKLGYARGKLVGTQEAHYFSSLQDREAN